MKTYCPNCDKETIHKKDHLHHVLHVGNIIMEGDVYGYICQECHADGIITDSSELDKKYTQTYRQYHNGMLTGEQIKKIRTDKKLSILKFVRMLHENGINYDEDEYKEIESNTRTQSGDFEVFVRKFGGFPEWAGYRV